MSATWWQAFDCECGRVNWVYMGDPDDLTRPDVSHIVCWGCLTHIGIVEDSDAEE